jgi:hypothetical protein
MPARYVYNAGNCWFHCGWMEIFTLHSWEHYNTHSKHHCIYYTQNCKVWLNDCHQRELALYFTICLLTHTSTDAKRTVMWWCILPNHAYILESLGENGILHSSSLHKLIYKIRFTCSYGMHYDTISTHHCAYFSENYVTSLQEYFHWHSAFHYGHHLLMTGIVLMQTIVFNSRAITDPFMGKMNITHHSCNHNNTHTHHCICNKKLKYKYKNIFISGNLHFNLHSLLKCLHWFKQIIYVMVFANLLTHVICTPKMHF